jgi:hypothetical protein
MVIPSPPVFFTPDAHLSIADSPHMKKADFLNKPKLPSPMIGLPEQ